MLFSFSESCGRGGHKAVEVNAGASWAAEREPDRGFGGAEEENTFQGSVALNKNRYISDLACLLCLLGLSVQKRPSRKLFKDKRMLYCILWEVPSRRAAPHRAQACAWLLSVGLGEGMMLDHVVPAFPAHADRTWHRISRSDRPSCWPFSFCHWEDAAVRLLWLLQPSTFRQALKKSQEEPEWTKRDKWQLRNKGKGTDSISFSKARGAFWIEELLQDPRKPNSDIFWPTALLVREKYHAGKRSLLSLKGKCLCTAKPVSIGKILFVSQWCLCAKTL